MADASTVLSAALAALALVYQAYTTVKSNRERCSQLVQRCQAVVDRLEAMTMVYGDAAVRCRLGELEEAFKKTATTIREVGQQGAIKSLLRSDENALRLEDCQFALSELITLLSLEHVVDMSAWQQENEFTRRKDHNKLVEISNQLRQSNAAVVEELSRHGETLEELSRTVNRLALSLDDDTETTTGHADTRHRSSSFSSSRTVRPRINYTRPRCLSVPNSSVTYIDEHGFGRDPSDHRNIQSGVGGQDSSGTRIQSLIDKSLPPTPPPSYRSFSFGSVSNATEADASLPDPSMNQNPQEQDTTSNTSNSPIPISYREPEVTNGEVLVELWSSPPLTNFESAVSLDDFAPLAAEQVRLAEEYASAVSSALNPFVRSRGFAGCSAIILCPRNRTPAVIVTREEQRQSVNRVKGYILDTQKLLTLVSVTYGHKTEFVLIPFSRDMTITNAKELIAGLFRQALVQSCHNVEYDVNLLDSDTFEGSGIEPFKHSLTMVMDYIPQSN